MFERTQKQHATLLGREQALMLQVRNPSFGRRLRYSAMVGRQTRGEAEKLCDSLRAQGGSCIVVKNQPG